LVCQVLLVGAWPTAAEAASHRSHHGPTPVVDASMIRKALSQGRALPVRSGGVVRKKLVLTGIDTVAVPFRCRNCDFKHGIDASGVTFERAVDLTGSRFEGRASFRGTTFAGPAVFAAAEACDRATFEGTADFSLAVFDDFATFENALFARKAVFDNGRFRDRANFGNACFDGPLSARAAVFERSAQFTEAWFARGAAFDSAAFAAGATFLGSRFTNGTDAPAATFDLATSGGDLDFTFASFGLNGVPPDERAEYDVASFSDVVSKGSLSFQDVNFPPQFGLAMDHLHVADLVLDVDVARQVDDQVGRDNKRDVLRLIESSSKKRGDLAVANDAHYQSEILAAKRYGEPWRLLDYVFYRGVAGYLVRPFRPLVVLLVLVVSLALLRVLLSGARPAVEAHSRRTFRPSVRSAARGSRSVLADALDTISLIGPRGSHAGTLPPARRLEIFAYRVLLVCALLALANSNPTLRQMVDSLF
jgi:hypothetical protein